MLNLIKFQLLHVRRTRSILLVLLMSYIVYYGSMKGSHSLQIQLNNNFISMGNQEVFGILFFAQMSMGLFLALLHGCWVAPYYHTERRVALSFVLPVEKWKVALSHFFSFSLLTLVQLVLVHLALFQFFGTSWMEDENFSLALWAGMLGLVFIVMVAVMYLTAFLSVYLGSKITFVVMNILGVVTWAMGSFYWFKKVALWDFSYEGIWIWLYRLMPPLGEMGRYAGQIYQDKVLVLEPFAHWGAWLLLSFGAFYFVLIRPKDV